MLHKLSCLYRYTQHLTLFFLLIGFLWSDFVSRFSFTHIITAAAGLALLVLYRVCSLSVCHCCVSVGTSRPCGVSLWTHYLSTHFNEVRRYHREHQQFLSKDVSGPCKCLTVILSVLLPRLCIVHVFQKWILKSGFPVVGHTNVWGWFESSFLCPMLLWTAVQRLWGRGPQ